MSTGGWMLALCIIHFGMIFSFTSTVSPFSSCTAQLLAVPLVLPRNRKWRNVAVLLEYATDSVSDPLDDKDKVKMTLRLALIIYMKSSAMDRMMRI